MAAFDLFEKQQQEKTGTEFSNLHAKHKMAFGADPVIIAMVSVVKGQVRPPLFNKPASDLVVTGTILACTIMLKMSHPRCSLNTMKTTY